MLPDRDLSRLSKLASDVFNKVPHSQPDIASGVISIGTGEVYTEPIPLEGLSNATTICLTLMTNPVFYGGRRRPEGSTLGFRIIHDPEMDGEKGNYSQVSNRDGTVSHYYYCDTTLTFDPHLKVVIRPFMLDLDVLKQNKEKGILDHELRHFSDLEKKNILRSLKRYEEGNVKFRTDDMDDFYKQNHPYINGKLLRDNLDLLAQMLETIRI